jgi:capsular polysaccharide biosynthesis protein
VSDYQPVDEPLGGPNAEPQPSRRYMGGFVSLHFVLKAISRRKRIWITLALVGLLVGMSLHVVIPRKYTAQTELLLFHNPNDDPTRDMATDVQLLQSEAVAQKVINKLHLQTTAEKLTGQYSGVASTDEILEITFNAPTSSEAVARATVLATGFLAFRTALFQEQNLDVTGALQKQVNLLDSQVSSINVQISALGNPAPGSAASSQIQGLQSERAGDINQASSLEATIQSDDLTTTSIIEQSHVVSGATPIVHSALKVLLVDSASGLIGGLALGLGLLAVLAIASDRIRQRGEFADALGAPVELSVRRFGRFKVLRTRRLRRRLSRPGRPVELMCRQLRADVHSGPAPKRLAVISVESLEPSALSVAILAGRLAVFEGKRVMVMDLSPGRVLGELLGVSEPETRIMFVKGAWVPMLVAVPHDDDPIEMTSIELPETGSETDGAPGPTWTSPEVVLVLSTLELGIGASHLARVADEAVVVVTAGRSSAAEIRSTAELIRAAGLTVRGAILVGADRNDESVGLIRNSKHAGNVPDGIDGLMETPFVSYTAAEHH